MSQRCRCVVVVVVIQSQLKMDKDVPNDIRKQRVAAVMQEVYMLFVVRFLTVAACRLFLKPFLFTSLVLL